MSTPKLPRSVTLNRIPSLDGLRAVSILMVVGLHTLQALNTLGHPVDRVWFGIFNGGSGVFIFFEISGFLITTLLLEEHRKRGSVSLRGFYLRRAFRILPPLYLYIGVIVLLGLSGRLVVARADVVSSALFFHNFTTAGTWWLEHLWSICVEEQFYFVWPFILVYCLRKPGGEARRRASLFPLAIIIGSPVARMLLGHLPAEALHRASRDIRFDFIMYGCVVALLQHTPRFEAVYRVATRIWWLPPAVMLGCNYLSTYFENRFDLTVGYTVSGFAIAMFMLWCTRNAGSAAGRMLNSWPMVKVGVLSYSIYLWQTLFLHPWNDAVFAWAPWIGRFPGSYLGILLAACGSYYVVEQPSLKLRAEVIRRFHVYWAKRSELRAAVG